MTEAEQNRLILDNMALVALVAGDFRGADIEYEDLLAVGREGLVKAARSFSPALGKFPSWATIGIDSAIRDAIRSGNYAKTESSIFDLEDIAEWGVWGNGGNALAIFERWPDHFDASSECLTELYDEIRDKEEKFSAAFISLSKLQRRLVRLVYSEGLTVTNAARESRISYLKAWRNLNRALRKMREVILRMESNTVSGINSANGSPLHRDRHGCGPGMLPRPW